MHTLPLRRPPHSYPARKPGQTAASALNIIDISFQEESSKSGQAGKSVLAAWQIQRLNAYIDECMGTRIRTMDLAAALELSVSHFSRIFKQSFGVSPRIYILHRRIASACNTMLLSDLHLTDIAYMHGFCDQSHFNRVFNSVHEVSPQEWRRLNKLSQSATDYRAALALNAVAA